MSGVRLVRCPKCDKVLPEPSDCPVYKCGGCGAVLRAKKKSSISDGLLYGSGDERLVSSADSISDKGSVGFEGRLDMANKSPARSTNGYEDGNDLKEFHGSLPKSPMRDRFLDDLNNNSVGMGTVNRSPIRERDDSDDFDGGDSLSVRSRNVSKSPVRGRAGTPLSVRSSNISLSPRREGTGMSAWKDGVDGSPARSVNGGNSKSPLRGGGVDGSPASSVNGGNLKSPLRGGLDSDLEGIGEGERLRKMAAKTSFGAWLPDDKKAGGQSHGDISDRREGTWRGQGEERRDQMSGGLGPIYSDEYDITSEGSVDDRIHKNNPRKGRIPRGRVSRGENFGGYSRPRANADTWVNDRDRVAYGTSNVLIEEGRLSASSSVVDVPSNYHTDPRNVYGDRNSFEGSWGPANVKDIHMERLELLRKKKELEDQLYNLDGSGLSYPGSYSGADDFSEDASSRSGGRPMQQFSGDRNVLRATHVNHASGPVHNMADVYNSNTPLYKDQYAGQIKKGPQPNLTHHSKQTMQGYVPGRSWDFDQDPFDPIVTHGHHPACNCSFCYANVRQDRNLPPPLDRRSGNFKTDLRSSYSMESDRRGPRVYDPRMASTGPQQRPSRLGNQHPRRAAAANLNKRLCRPIAGGAPFVICHSCFQLLKLPAKFTRKQKDLHQLQCGACSVVISFDLQQSFVDQLSSQQKSVSSHLDDAEGGSNEVKYESEPQHHRDSFAASSTNVGSYDFDAAGYSFQAMDTVSTVSKGEKFHSTVPQNTWGRPTSPAHLVKDEQNSDTASNRSSQPNSSEILRKIPPPPGSPLRDHLDYSTQFKISQAGLTAERKQVLEKESPEGSLDVMDGDDSGVPFSDLTTTTTTTSLPQDSGHSSKQSPVARDNKEPQSPAHNILDFENVARDSGRADVYVNGQAVSHRLVKKAEKLAGPINPGDYWYDPKAGFWGVMGHRCLGIIPPSIQEFSLPIPENCSVGDTTVYVNGRELHRRDLDLLASRGLPTVKDKRYVIEISGRALQEDTRDFVVNLGRLAPSVEKNKCGFGMQVPQQLDD